MRFEYKRFSSLYTERPTYFSRLRWACSLAVLCLLILPTEACRKQNAIGVIVLYRVDNAAAFIEMALEEIERLPGSEQFNIKFVNGSESRNVFTSRSVEIEKAAEFVKIPNLIGVIGHDDSRSSLLSAPIYNKAEVLQIVPMGTSSKLKDAGRWTFMLAPDDRAEGKFLGLFVATSLQAHSATIFFEDDEYGTGLKDGVVDTLKQQDVTILDVVAFHALHGLSADAAREKYTSIVAASLSKGKPDVVVIAGRTREAGQIARLFNQRAPGIPFVAGDGVEVGSDLFESAQQATDLFYVATFWLPGNPDRKSRDFAERFLASAGRRPMARDAMKYDAAVLLAKAAIECGFNHDAIRVYLGELGLTRPAYKGVTGDITFLPDRPQRMVMTRVENGKGVPVNSQ